MNSQNQEEKFILEYFQDFKGRFLDVGSYDGRTFSNTLALAERGWSGVCIEPEPTSFNGLKQTYKDNENIELVNAAFDIQNRLIKFYDSAGSAVSTTSKSHADKWVKDAPYKAIWVNTITIQDILNNFGRNFDMISLDVEGTNIELLQTLPLDAMGVRLICVEHDYQYAKVYEYCKGFKEIHRNGENLIMAR